MQVPARFARSVQPSPVAVIRTAFVQENADAVTIRLVGAILMEQNDEWAVSRRYTTLETLAQLGHRGTDTPPADLHHARGHAMQSEPTGLLMPQSTLSLIVEPDELERHLGRPDLLIVDLAKPAFLDQLIHAQSHVPGAVGLKYGEIITTRPPAMGLLPDDRQLGDVLSSVGMTPETHVVAYDSEGNGKACRFLWTLDVIGHPNFSLLNGGLQAWLNEGHRTEGSLNKPRRSDYKVARQAGPVANKDPVADKDFVLAHLDDPGVVILDTRTPAEFSGVDKRAARGGHIPGAINMDWTLAIDRERNLRLASGSELRELLEDLGVTPDKEVITYCQTHLRSAHTYITLKALGFPRIRGYPGSWSEWGNDLELPIET